MSHGAAQLYNLLREYFPGKKIIKEYTFSNRLRLDFYMPELNIAFEFDGPHHQRFCEHFHKTKTQFYIAQNRDEQKEYICQQLGINLIRFSNDEELSLKAIDKRYTGPGSGEVQENAARWLNKAAEAKQSKITSRKMTNQKYKNSDAHKEKLRKAAEWRKAKRKELKAKGY